ncbi:hypothetical protein FK545_11740 [Planococcus glaciei]|nr:hypothetical protein [Planococcus glaciei]QDY45859.1 hypothetical protein FK545_11740 [Planococcus glaciei]
MEKMVLVKNQSVSSSPPKYKNEDYIDAQRPLEQDIVDIEKYLMEQIPFNNDLSATERKMLLYCINNLNESGYLDISLEDVAGKFDAAIESAEGALQLLQTFEPVGIGARNLKECLLIQVSQSYSKCSLPYQIVDLYLDDLAEGALKNSGLLWKAKNRNPGCC